MNFGFDNNKYSNEFGRYSTVTQILPGNLLASREARWASGEANDCSAAAGCLSSEIRVVRYSGGDHIKSSLSRRGYPDGIDAFAQSKIDKCLPRL
jgi:hypothetical protein